jgi:hypothetical protein
MCQLTDEPLTPKQANEVLDVYRGMMDEPYNLLTGSGRVVRVVGKIPVFDDESEDTRKEMVGDDDEEEGNQRDGSGRGSGRIEGEEEEEEEEKEEDLMRIEPDAPDQAMPYDEEFYLKYTQVRILTPRVLV